MSKPTQDSRSKGSNVRLFAHLQGEDKQRTLAAWEGSSTLFDKTIRKVIEEKIQISYNAIDNIDVYSITDRAGYLADQSGYRRALKELLMLLPTDV